MNLFPERKQTVSVAVTLASAIAFGCIAAVVIAAVPNDSADEYQPISTEEPIRITAPIDDASFYSSLLDPAVTCRIETEEDAITSVTSGFRVDAPEITEEVTAEPETTVVETTVIETTVIETTAPETTAPETTAPETTAPETTVPETTAPETTAPETTAPEPAPTAAVKEPLLVDELDVVHTIKEIGFSVTEQEIIYAATIIQLEVMGNGSKLGAFEDQQLKYWEMLAVAQCIRNRVESDRFPDTASDVMFQSITVNGKKYYQFNPSTILDYYTPTDEAITAAREVLTEGVTVLPTDYYYFCATRIEENFEAWNDFMLIDTADGSYEKTRGHLTTFYAGHE